MEIKAMAVTKPLTLFGLFMMLLHVINLWQNYFFEVEENERKLPACNTWTIIYKD